MSAKSPAGASTGLTQLGGLTGRSPGTCAPRARLYQVWARLSGNWVCCFAAPDRDAALQFARPQFATVATAAARASRFARSVTAASR